MENVDVQTEETSVESWGQWFESWRDTIFMNSVSSIVGGLKVVNATVRGLYAPEPAIYIPTGILSIADHLMFMWMSYRNGFQKGKCCALTGRHC